MNKPGTQGIGEIDKKWQAACALAALFAFCVGFMLGTQRGRADVPKLSGIEAVAVSETSATLKALINPGTKATTYRFEVGLEDCESTSCAIVGQGSAGSGSSPTLREAFPSELTPATLYHYRVIATNNEGEAKSGDLVFATRSGIFKGLPDQRAYEQASPLDKNGNDAMGDVPTVKATASGGGITFASTFGIPGGKGAQEFPTYLASRGTSNWSTQGILPPPSAGERAQVVGWSPDYTEIFSNVSKLEAQKVTALVVQSTTPGAPQVQITPYVAKADFFYAGQSKDGRVVLFESDSKLLPEALEGFSNLYAWDRDSGSLSLAGVMNDEASPPKGTLAGPYSWTTGSSGRPLSLGGADRGYYLRDENAISPDGAAYFTEVGTGQLYLRLNPTKAQSPLDVEGNCEDLTLACTLRLSASHKTDGQGPGGIDSAGPQPAAFQAASADGSEAFFTSPEKLTNDANTGPEQPPARIERDDLSGGTIETPDFISPQKAVGIAVDEDHVYWADPSTGAIGRADLDGDNRDPAFILPGPIECEVKGEPGVFEDVASTPRYVAVDSGHVYWTNTGCSDEFGPLNGKGTIGRADIEGTEASIEPEFITGASNPQGIAVNATHIYWANAGKAAGVRAIGRAEIDGEEINQSFVKVTGNDTSPTAVALSETHLYFGVSEAGTDNAYLRLVPLGGGEVESNFVGKRIRGVAVDGSHAYWATQAEGEEAIGRAELDLSSPNKAFIPLEGKPNGLAVDAAHLYWATNGEAPSNPGNDLYRYGPGVGQLEDLTPLPSGNGAEVQGVLGASGDGKYVYFAANGVLDDAEEAEPGDCKGPLGGAKGSCSLYLWHDGAISFVARLNAAGSEASDALNWAATPRNLFGTASYVPKTSFISADGRSLLFRSRERLTDYANAGVPQFYRFEVGEGLSCATCNPAGESATEGPKTGRILFPGLGPLASVLSVSSRNFASSGDRFFFETREALVPEDTNGQGGCPPSGTGVQLYPACTDVYEWEAKGAGSCKEGSPGYSQINNGCIYLLSSGKSPFPSLFADASASGDDVFFFTREALVGQDKDELQDVYDARVGGGLAAQAPVASVPCEGTDACHGPLQSPPTESAPGSATFVGPGNPVPKHKKQKAKKHKKKHKGKGKGKRQKRANEKGRVSR